MLSSLVCSLAHLLTPELVEKCWVIRLLWTIVQHLILNFPTSLGMSLGEVRANDWTDKQVAQYLRLDFLLFWTKISWWRCPTMGQNNVILRHVITYQWAQECMSEQATGRTIGTVLMSGFLFSWTSVRPSYKLGKSLLFSHVHATL